MTVQPRQGCSQDLRSPWLRKHIQHQTATRTFQEGIPCNKSYITAEGRPWDEVGFKAGVDEKQVWADEGVSDQQAPRSISIIVITVIIVIIVIVLIA